MKKAVKISRDTVLLIVGILGVAHETLINNTDRPTLLLLFAAMIGLPAFINQDERRKNDSPRSDSFADD